MKKLLTILLVVIISGNIFSQKKYNISINVDDMYNYKEVSGVLYGIFDSMPKYVEKSNTFIVESFIDVDENKLNEKLTTLGYRLIFFKREEEK